MERHSPTVARAIDTQERTLGGIGQDKERLLLFERARPSECRRIDLGRLSSLPEVDDVV